MSSSYDLDALQAAGPGLEDLLQAEDPLIDVARQYGDLHGKHFGRDGLRAIMFLQGNGSADLAGELMKNRKYLGSPKPLIELVKELSPATYQKQILEYQAAAAAKAKD